MNGKTKVVVIKDIEGCSLYKGDRGYIDGYVTSNGRHDAVVVSMNQIGNVPIYALKAYL